MSSSSMTLEARVKRIDAEVLMIDLELVGHKRMRDQLESVIRNEVLSSDLSRAVIDELNWRRDTIKQLQSKRSNLMFRRHQLQGAASKARAIVEAVA
jgi:hypothetical protein